MTVYNSNGQPIDAHDFWSKVNKQDGPDCCWLWTGRTNPGGYGTFSGKLAHCVAYELEHGPVPSGKELHHTCGVKLCMRHLAVVDRTMHKRTHKAIRCNQCGTVLTGQNRDGNRSVCRSCRNAYHRSLYHATKKGLGDGNTY